MVQICKVQRKLRCPVHRLAECHKACLAHRHPVVAHNRHRWAVSPVNRQCRAVKCPNKWLVALRLLAECRPEHLMALLRGCHRAHRWVLALAECRRVALLVQFLEACPVVHRCSRLKAECRLKVAHRLRRCKASLR